MTISNESRARFKAVFEPLALAMGRVGLTPNGLTLIGFGITAVGAILLAIGAWLPGGIVVFLGGAFDMFDGTLARATGKVSKLGAFMDSVFDRWGEAIVYLGIVIGAVTWRAPEPGPSLTDLSLMAVLAAAAMGAAFMVSYARAKAEGLGFTAGTGMAEVGLMPREIRLVVLSLGLVIGGIVGIGHRDLQGGALWVELALGVIAVLATVTVIQRIVHVRRQAASGRPGQ